MSEGGASMPLVLMIALASPAALGVETLLRWLVFPDDFEVLRQFLEPYLTPIAWGLAAITLLAALAIAPLYRASVKQKLARLPADATPASRAAAWNGPLLLVSSLPQVPALFATIAFMLGAGLAPVASCMVLSTLGVLVPGVLVRKV